MRFTEKNVVRQEQALLLNIPFVLQEYIVSFLGSKDIVKLSGISKKGYNLTEKIMKNRLEKLKNILNKEENPNLLLSKLFVSAEYALFWSQRIDQKDMVCFNRLFEKKFFPDNYNGEIYSVNQSLKTNFSLDSWVVLGPKNRSRFLACLGGGRSPQFQRALKLAIFPINSFGAVQISNWIKLSRDVEMTETVESFNFIQKPSRRPIQASTYLEVFYRYFYEIAHICCKFNQLDKLKEILEKIKKIELSAESQKTGLLNIDVLYRHDQNFCKKFFLESSLIGKDILLNIAKKHKNQDIIDFLSPKKRINEEKLNDEDQKKGLHKKSKNTSVIAKASSIPSDKKDESLLNSEDSDTEE